MKVEYINISSCKEGDIIIFRKNFDDTFAAKFEVVSMGEMVFVAKGVKTGKNLVGFQHFYPKVYKVIEE